MVTGGLALLLGALIAVTLADAGPATGQHAPGAAKRHGARFICRHAPGSPDTGGGRHFPHHREPPEKVKCRLGQRGVTGPIGAHGQHGAVGTAGPTGSTGPAGPGPNEVVVNRVTIPFTTNGSGAPLFQSDGGNVQNLATIGPIHVDGLCRHTFPNNNGGAGPGGGERNASGRPNTTVRYPAPFFTSIGGEDEAQVLIWSETGSLSFNGQHGKRTNVPSGPPDYALETLGSPSAPGLVPTGPGGNNKGGGNMDNAHSPEPSGPVTPTADPVAGEGDHLFLAASNETVDENRATDPAADNQGSSSVRRLNRYPAFDYSSGWAGTSDGHLIQLEMIGGFDVLGIYDQCVFSGVVRGLA
jgi:hypothetical protein